MHIGGEDIQSNYILEVYPLIVRKEKMLPSEWDLMIAKEKIKSQSLLRITHPKILVYHY